MAKILRPVLDVAEIPPERRNSRTHLPSLRQFISPRAADSEDDLLRYLSQGVAVVLPLGSWLGYDLLRLPEEKVRIEPIPAPLPRRDGHLTLSPQMAYTDAIWFWFGAMLHYVKQYHVRLDPVFVLHAKSLNWTFDWDGVKPHELDLTTIY